MTLETPITQTQYQELLEGNTALAVEIIKANLSDDLNSAAEQDVSDKIDDSRVQVDSVDPYSINVELIGSTGEIYFDYNWSIYHGCKDMDEQDEETISGSLVITPGSLKLEFIDLPEREDEI